MTKEEALSFTEDTRQMVHGTDKVWMQIALRCIDAREKRVWEVAEFESFGTWMLICLGKSRSYVYTGIRAVEELNSDFKRDEIADISLANAIVLAKVPNSRRRELLESAHTEPNRMFVDTVNKTIPDLHLEVTTTMSFRVTAEQRTGIEGKLDDVGKEHELDKRGDQLAALCGVL